jgi:transcriptional regulator with XRE-family HTH domain
LENQMHAYRLEKAIYANTFFMPERQRMKHFIDKEKKVFVGNLRKQRERVFPGRGGDGLLAKAAGVSPRLLSQWMNGKRAPSPEQVDALAKALGVDVLELRGRRKAKAGAPGADRPDIVMGQVDAIDTMILMLWYNKRALLGETDGSRHRECMRIIRQLMEKELEDGEAAARS